MTSKLLATVLVMALAGAACSPAPEEADADVIVVGGGITGLSAAIEASDAGARVLVVEMASVGGGHAVRAGGFSLVGTPLQESKGIQDSPELAYRDMMAWGENADPYWVRRFAEESRSAVHDWLTGMGVQFAFIIDTPEDSVPRFHFTRGAAVNAVVPVLRTALARENISFLWNTEAVSLIRTGDAVTGVRIRNTRTDAQRTLISEAVILATGGFQSNLGMVRATWRADRTKPERLLIGSGEYARGSGVGLGEDIGAELVRMDRHVTYVAGLPDPREQGRGFLTQNPRTIWVNAEGQRFVNEDTSIKEAAAAVFAQSAPAHWLIFDAEGRKRLIIRGAAWLSRETIQKEIIENADLVKQADSIEELASLAGLPVTQLAETVERFNEFSAQGADPDYQRFAAEGSKPFTITTPPYYAIQLYPMTRKSMGGLAIDEETRVLDTAGEPIPGLFAAGELTGVAGINGSHGGSGTFLGPSVLLGRIAGRTAAASAITNASPGATEHPPGSGIKSAGEVSPAHVTAAELSALLATKRPGYWHFESSHSLVLEREFECTQCHTAEWPAGPATTKAQRLVQLESCTNCH